MIDHSFCYWVIGGMATAITALAGFIVAMIRAERTARREHLKTYREHEEVLRAMLEEVVQRKGNS